MALFSCQVFSEISQLPETLNRIFCVTKTELQYYPTLASNEIWVWNGAELPHEGGAMGKKIDNRKDREQWANDFERLAQPYLDQKVPSLFLCAELQLPEHGSMFSIYASMAKLILNLKHWSEQTDSLLACSVRYGSTIQAPNLSVISLQKHPKDCSKAAIADYKASLNELLKGVE